MEHSTIASIVGMSLMVVSYLQAPTLLGVGRITVKTELPAAGGLYRFSNVTIPAQPGLPTSMARDMGQAKPSKRGDTRVRVRR